MRFSDLSGGSTSMEGSLSNERWEGFRAERVFRLRVLGFRV